jgi:hypothetical protein
MCRIAVKAGKVQLLPVAVPFAPGRYRLGLLLEEVPERMMQVIEVVVTAAPPARLLALPPQCAARSGEPFRLVFEARSASGGRVPVPAALLDALRSTSAAVTLERRELLPSGAAVAVRIAAAPGQASVRLRTDATAALPALDVAWEDISVEAGPPADAIVSGAALAGCGAFVVAQGAALALDVTFTDAHGYAAAAEHGAVVAVDADEQHAWLAAHDARRVWPLAADGAAIGPLHVARDAPLGRHILRCHRGAWKTRRPGCAVLE